MSANFWIASMVWAPKYENSAAGVGLARASERRIDASVPMSAYDIRGMAPLSGKTQLFLL